MSRIDELIQQLCPDGVEYKPLGDIMQIRRGASPRPIQEYITKQDDGIPWIKIGDVNPRSKFIVKTDQKITVSGAKKSCYLKKGDFILSNSMSFGRPYILAIDGCIHDGWIAMSNFERSFNSDFLFYLLRTQMIQKFWRQKASSGTVQNLNSDIVRDTSVPVPPLPVQEEIVRILDKFTALEAELEAELEARRKQYEFYRDQLLNFKGLMSRGAGSLVSLGDLFDFKNGLNKSKEFFGSGYPIVNFTDVFKKNHLYATDLKGRVQVTADEISRYSVQKGDVFFTRTSETREEIGMASVVLDDIGDCVFSGFVLRARPKTTLLLPQYCGFCFRHNDVRKQIIQRASFTTRALTSGTALAKIQIPVPPLTEQERIVAILDKFDALVNDISSGLPAELEMRRKQYEYYRDRLLTFKPLAKEA